MLFRSLAAHVLPPVVLVAAIMAVVQVQNVCDPTNTANVWIANFTGVPIDAITKRTLPYQVGVAVAATLAVVLAAPALFGQAPFASPLPVANAQELLPGLYAPADARDVVAIDDDGTPLGRAAADAAAEALAGGSWRPLRLHEDPNADDCARKRYSAYILVESSTFHLVEGDDVDVGLRLEDCGGWIVSEWHDHEVVTPPPDAVSARALALQGVARVHTWAAAEAVRSANLFGLGLATRPGTPPTYYYAFFTSADGNMRAYVRAGGPAYVAGLRSGDVIQKIDGLDWWMYGTYQAQQRAYDGKPHVFEIRRGGRSAEVRLSAPFVSGGQG